MNLIKYISVLPLALSLIGVVQAKSFTHPIPVPFNQITLAEGEKIQADYHFGAHQTIVCREASHAQAASLEWKYKGVTYKKMLPVTLKDDKRYSGEWADSGSLLMIANEHGHDDLHVSCEYRNID
jgi:hypothetical protein